MNTIPHFTRMDDATWLPTEPISYLVTGWSDPAHVADLASWDYKPLSCDFLTDDGGLCNTTVHVWHSDLNRAAEAMMMSAHSDDELLVTCGNHAQHRTGQAIVDWTNMERHIASMRDAFITEWLS